MSVEPVFTSLVKPMRRAYRGGTVESKPHKKCAWVVLVMIGDSYIPGALVIGQSLRSLKTQHDIVCMVTNDVSESARAQLRGTGSNPVYDLVQEVPYIEHLTFTYTAKKQIELYGGWSSRSYTKWNCLNLHQYDRVILLDADMVVLANIDSLFDLKVPAACFSNPWAAPWQRRSGTPVNPYVKPGCKIGQEIHCDPRHGSVIRAVDVNKSLKTGGFVGWGAVVLLEPTKARYAAFLKFLDEKKVFGLDLKSISSSDEMAIAQFYSRESDWTNIHQRFLAIPWKENWVSRDVHVYHYHGRKPWDMDLSEWPDLADWWKVAEQLIKIHPNLQELFHPTITDVARVDADSAQLRITNDIRSTIVGCAKSNKHLNHHMRATIDMVLLKWITAMSSMKPNAAEWASVYRLTNESDHINIKLAQEIFNARITDSYRLAESLVGKFLALIKNRLGKIPRPTRATFDCRDGILSYGSHFTVPVTSKTDELVQIGGCQATVEMMLRYSILSAGPSSNQLLIPANHANYLHTTCGVRNEGFVSPATARFIGDEYKDARYFSQFADTDAVFGSAGEFFHVTEDIKSIPEKYPGNWVIGPHMGVSESALVSRVTDIVEAVPVTIFIVSPSTSSLTLLRDSTYYMGESEITGKRFESPSGDSILADTVYTYYAISSENHPQEYYSGALDHLAN